MSRTTAALMIGSLFCVVLPARAEELADEYGEELLSASEKKRIKQERKQAGPPVLNVSPSYLRVTVQEGETKTPSLTVSNAGGQTLNWRVRSQGRLLQLYATSGSLGYRAKKYVRVRLRTSGMKPGTYRDQLVFEAPGASGSPRTISVTVTVEPKRASEPPVDAKQDPTPKPQPREREPVRERKPRTSRDVRDTRPLDRSAHDQKRGRFAVRVGYVLPASGDQADATGGVLLAFARTFNGSRSVTYELAAELRSAVEVGHYSSQPVGVGFNVVYSLKTGYVFGGGTGHLEFVTDNDTGAESTNGSLSVDVGGGLMFAEEKADVRLSYQVFLGSSYLGGQAVLSVGYRF